MNHFFLQKLQSRTLKLYVTCLILYCSIMASLQRKKNKSQSTAIHFYILLHITDVHGPKHAVFFCFFHFFKYVSPLHSRKPFGFHNFHHHMKINLHKIWSNSNTVAIVPALKLIANAAS